MSLRVFGEDITVAGRQAAAVAGKQGTTPKEVIPVLEDASFLRQTNGTTEGAPQLKSEEEEKTNLL